MKRRKETGDGTAPASQRTRYYSSGGGPEGRHTAGGGTRPAKLPAHLIASELLRRLETERVVFVQGFTGSGKSSQIPQVLCDGPAPWFGARGSAKVLCTQPRRLAVAAVACRVAQERGCRIGGEVGYTIGQQSLQSASTRLLFSTAGIALETLRASGPDALLAYSTVIVDEIHERSEQSDLLIACLREFMMADRRMNSLRLVLMSATFDTKRYTEYLAPLGIGGKPLKVVPIPRFFGKMLSSALFPLKTHYLEEAIESVIASRVAMEEAETAALGGPHASLIAAVKVLGEAGREILERWDAEVEEGGVSAEMHRLLARLLVAVLFPAFSGRAHGGEVEDADSGDVLPLAPRRAAKTALVFLPTYRTLEEAHELLTELGCFRLAVLHSSVDIEEGLRSIAADEPASSAQGREGLRPKVILATNVAESSLTIPGVSLVVDLCRRLQVCWDAERQASRAQIHWASRSQLDQRKGRTGRCCAGTVYRLVPRQYHLSMPQWEPAELEVSDLAESALLLATSSHRAMRQVSVMMSRCLNPPKPPVVTDAMARLTRWGLLREGNEGSQRATTFGAIVGQLPLSLTAGRVVVIGSAVGLMAPAAVLGAIISTTPQPILRPFGEAAEHERLLERFRGQPTASQDTCGSLLAQLAAFSWWEADWADRRRLEQLGVKSISEHTGPRCVACREPLNADYTGVEAMIAECNIEIGAGATVSGVLCESCQALQETPNATGRLETLAAARAAETEEQRWCRRTGLSLVALHAVRQTADTVISILARSDLRQGLWDRRNRACPPSLWPARSRPVTCEAESILNADTNGGMVRRLQQLLQTVVCPPTPCCAPSYDELSAEGKRLGCAHRSRIDPVEVGRTPICRFFVGGGGDCWQGGGDGDNCAFRHITLAGERPPHCTWYFSSWGCKYGASCRHSHPLPRGGLLDECKLAGSMVAGRPGHDAALMAQRASGPNGGLCGMLAGKVVMLVGEGDFSFSFALFSRTPTPPAQLIATGLHDAAAMRRAYATAHESAAQSEEIDWQVPALQEWCGPTGPPPTVQLMHGVDATKLGESEAFKHFARFTDGDSVNRVLGWQFPFNGRADDAAGNGRILAAFFRSIATACLAGETSNDSSWQLAHSFRIFLTVQGDQAARWGLLRSAREAMFFLEDMLAFDADELAHPVWGYTTRRTAHPLEALELKRPVTFVFRPCRPIAVLAHDHNAGHSTPFDEDDL